MYEALDVPNSVHVSRCVTPTEFKRLTLYRGLGNLIGMPIAIAVGRRVVLLVATVLLLLGAILCATAKSFELHLAARILLGIAAGQSESVGPMIIQVRL